MKKTFLLFSLLIISVMTFAQLKPVSPNPPVPPVIPTGTISISSTPHGCYVKINGETVGKTPLKIKKPVGKYEVIFDLIGFETISKTITVTAGKTTRCNVKMSEKKLTPLDSLLITADEIMEMKSVYTGNFLLNEEGNNIVSFQKDVINYVRNVKDIYTSSVSKEKGANMSDEELKAIITNNLLRYMNNPKMEGACTKQAMTFVKNIMLNETNVKYSVNFVYGTLQQLESASKYQPLDTEKVSTIGIFVGQGKYAEAAGIIDEALHEVQIVKRYSLFFKFLKDFFNAGNMRLEELKDVSNNK